MQQDSGGSIQHPKLVQKGTRRGEEPVRGHCPQWPSRTSHSRDVFGMKKEKERWLYYRIHSASRIVNSNDTVPGRALVTELEDISEHALAPRPRCGKAPDPAPSEFSYVPLLAEVRGRCFKSSLLFGLYFVIGLFLHLFCLLFVSLVCFAFPTPPSFPLSSKMHCYSYSFTSMGCAAEKALAPERYSTQLKMKHGLSFLLSIKDRGSKKLRPPLTSFGTAQTHLLKEFLCGGRRDFPQ